MLTLHERHYAPSVHLLRHCSHSRSPHLYLPFTVGHGIFRILPLGFHGSRTDNQENVEGQTPSNPILIPKPPPLTPKLEHRLVLHLLRPPIPALSHPPRHQSPLVPLSSPRIQLPLDPPLGYRRHQSQAVGGASLDVLCRHLRRGAGFRFLRRGHHARDLGVEVGKREDWAEEGS